MIVFVARNMIYRAGNNKITYSGSCINGGKVIFILSQKLQVAYARYVVRNDMWKQYSSDQWANLQAETQGNMSLSTTPLPTHSGRCIQVELVMHATVDVYLLFSGSPYLRSFIRHQKLILDEKRFYLMSNHIAQVRNKTVWKSSMKFFWRFWVKAPCRWETPFQPKCAISIVAPV